MTNKEAITVLNMIEAHGSLPIQAKERAIEALEEISHLINRPCEACEFHGEYGCCKWECVFKGV